jgi:hypothetical protein
MYWNEKKQLMYWNDKKVVIAIACCNWATHVANSTLNYNSILQFVCECFNYNTRSDYQDRPMNCWPCCRATQICSVAKYMHARTSWGFEKVWCHCGTDWVGAVHVHDPWPRGHGSDQAHVSKSQNGKRFLSAQCMSCLQMMWWSLLQLMSNNMCYWMSYRHACIWLQPMFEIVSHTVAIEVIITTLWCITNSPSFDAGIVCRDDNAGHHVSWQFAQSLCLDGCWIVQRQNAPEGDATLAT